MTIGDLYIIRDTSLDWKVTAIVLKEMNGHPSFWQFNILSVETDGDNRSGPPGKVGENVWIDTNWTQIRLTKLSSVVE